jgi:predicted alpha/beta hydrolase
MPKAEAFQVHTKDDILISATLFSSEKKSAHLIIMCPAAGAPQHYYKAFAEYASGYRDFDVVTFDYRGIGLSKSLPVTKETAKMSDWGTQDLQSIIDWADDKYDKICLLGHSVAGQIFPKSGKHDRILAAYFVGSQSAYHGHWNGFWWLYVLIFWYLLIPLSTFFLGYLPGWAMGGNIPLPKSIAQEWRKWGTHPNGVLQDDPAVANKFESVDIHVHFVNIDDDKLLAPSAATQALMHQYKNAITTFQFIKPSDLKLKKIGHFGFFKRKFAKQLWPMPMYYFSQFVNKLD